VTYLVASHDFGSNSLSLEVNANFHSTRFHENLVVCCRIVGIRTDRQTDTTVLLGTPQGRQRAQVPQTAMDAATELRDILNFQNSRET